MKKTAKIIWQFTRFFALLIGIVTALYAFLPFDRLKIFANSLASDGNLELFSPALYANTRPIALVGSILLLVFLLLLTLFRQKSLTRFENGLNALHHFPALLWADRKIFWQQARAYITQDHDWLILLFFILVGAFFRIQLVNKPVYHDEAYTYLGFVLGGLKNVISDYHQPNNHILFSVFMLIATQLFGFAPWVLRLPAVLAGLLLIPATYFVTRQAFSRTAGLLSSGIVTVFPIFSLYATSARGYTQLALLSTLLWLWAMLLLKQKNRYLWLLFIVTALAGFYTIPIMVYPYTAVMGWLFFMWLFKKHSPAYTHKSFFIYLFLSGVVVVIFFILLYTPVFLNTGVASVFDNVTIQKQQLSEFHLLLDSMRARGFRSWEEWHTGMPVWLGQVTLLGVLLGLLYTLLVKRQSPSYFLVSLLIFVGLIVVQRAVGWRRVWFFFAPVYFSYAAGGISYLLERLFRQKNRWLVSSVGILLVLATSATFVWLQSPTQEMRHLRGEPSAVERGVLYLADILTPTDAMLVNADYSPQMQYYAKYHGIDIEQTRPANNRFTSLYVMLILPDETVEGVLHGGTNDRVDLSASELIYAKAGDDLRIYRVPIVVFYDD